MQNTINQIKELLKNISNISESTAQNVQNQVVIDYLENPLEPNLLSYCFDNILEFDVEYRIAEKVNYIIEFDYKGTYAVARHYKMSYRVYIDGLYKDELIQIFRDAKPLLQELFLLISKESLKSNDFSMKNETISYLQKLEFFEHRIEELEGRKNVEMIYHIETYIDTFFSAMEHVLTLLYPFAENFPLSVSYYQNKIRSTKWSWIEKYKDVLGENFNIELREKLKRIKEIYRNHNAHGGFSREMMAYVNIPKFGRYPLYIGKEYLKGFIDGEHILCFDLFKESKEVFQQFWDMLDSTYEIPMLFIKSGLPIPVDTSVYTRDIHNTEQAERFIDKMWFEIDNQSNMDW